MSERRRWTILAVGTFAQAATCCFLYGIPMLVPALRADGLSLFGASLLVSAPMVGLLLTLILWGAAADRYGERVVIASGVGAAAVLLAVAVRRARRRGARAVLLALAGAFGASVNAASGRVVMGWFPPAERGLAMGTRQTAQPLGVALAALGLPSAGPRARRPSRAAVPGRHCARRPRARARPRGRSAADRRGRPARPPARRRTAARGLCRGCTWPARCWSCRSSRSRRSPSSISSASGTGTRPPPGG